MKDRFHEFKIRMALRCMVLGDRLRQRAYARMVALIQSRSPAQVERMERERGLV
jgi:hypothetical protein